MRQKPKASRDFLKLEEALDGDLRNLVRGGNVVQLLIDSQPIKSPTPRLEQHGEVMAAAPARLMAVYDQGYNTSGEPEMDRVSAEIFEEVVNDHMMRRACWVPSRFKRFPRFTIFTQRNQLAEKAHLHGQIISLNPHVLAMLAANDASTAL